MDLPKHSTSGKSGKSKHYFPIHMSSQTVFTDTYKYYNHRNTEYKVVTEHIDVTDRELLERRPVPSLKCCVSCLVFTVGARRRRRRSKLAEFDTRTYSHDALDYNTGASGYEARGGCGNTRTRPTSFSISYYNMRVRTTRRCHVYVSATRCQLYYIFFVLAWSSK